jgi:hypothetical protein
MKESKSEYYRERTVLRCEMLHSRSRCCRDCKWQSMHLVPIGWRARVAASQAHLSSMEETKDEPIEWSETKVIYPKLLVPKQTPGR